MEVFIALVALTIGAVAGFIAGRIWSVRHDQTAALTRQLDATHAEYSQYQNQIDQHFHKTAELINNLTHTYSEIHQHLSEGAQRLSKRTLAKTPIEQNFLQPNETTPTLESKVPLNNAIEAPRDYAPKNNNEPRTLPENLAVNSPTDLDTTTPPRPPTHRH